MLATIIHGEQERQGNGSWKLQSQSIQISRSSRSHDQKIRPQFHGQRIRFGKYPCNDPGYTPLIFPHPCPNKKTEMNRWLVPEETLSIIWLRSVSATE
jgi:hypothetical protein